MDASLEFTLSPDSYDVTFKHSQLKSLMIKLVSEGG